MWNRAVCDSIVLFIVLSLCFAGFYAAVHEGRKYRAKIRESQKEISDSLIIRILSFIAVVILIAGLCVPLYFIAKWGMDAMNMKNTLMLHYIDYDLVNILDLAYKLCGMFLITVSFIMLFLYLLVLGFATNYFFVKPDVDDSDDSDICEINEDNDDDEIDNKEIKEDDDDTDDDGYTLI